MSTSTSGSSPRAGSITSCPAGSAKLRLGDTNPGKLTEKTFDTDRSFMLVEIVGRTLYFQTISRTGETVDKGFIRKLAKKPVAATLAPAPVARP